MSVLQAFAKPPDALGGETVEVQDRVSPTIIVPDTPQSPEVPDPCLILTLVLIGDFVSGSCQPYFLWKVKTCYYCFQLGILFLVIVNTKFCGNDMFSLEGPPKTTQFLFERMTYQGHPWNHAHQEALRMSRARLGPTKKLPNLSLTGYTWLVSIRVVWCLFRAWVETLEILNIYSWITLVGIMKFFSISGVENAILSKLQIQQRN